MSKLVSTTEKLIVLSFDTPYYTEKTIFSKNSDWKLGHMSYLPLAAPLTTVLTRSGASLAYRISCEIKIDWRRWSIFTNFALLVDKEFPRAHVAKLYGRLRLIRCIWRAFNFPVFKGTWTRLVKLVYNFFRPKTFIHQQYDPSLNRTTIFKLIVHGTELHAAFEERENKQKNAKF